MEGNMNRVMYRDMIEENLISSAKQLNLARRWTFQRDNELKHTARIPQDDLLTSITLKTVLLEAVSANNSFAINF